MTSSAQTPEPTDEQRAVAQALCADLLWPHDMQLHVRGITRALAAAVTAEREKYLRVAGYCDERSRQENAIKEDRMAEGNEPASILCAGMSLAWEHAAALVRREASR